MSDLTVNPDFKVDTRERLITISNKDAVILICPICGNTKNVFLHAIPLHSEMEPQARLKTGMIQYPFFQQCHCNKQTPVVDLQKILRDISTALATCKTIDDAQRLLQTLASREEMKESS